jgi:hypothetical protein
MTLLIPYIILGSLVFVVGLYFARNEGKTKKPTR